MREVVFRVLAERPGHLEAQAITLPTRVHPYVPPLLAELPAGWRASLEPTSYDQGAVGETQLLRIYRVGPSPAQQESVQPLPAPG